MQPTTARDLSGTVAVVTGASSGIGEATARALSVLGATVALVARRADRLQQLAHELAEAGGQADPVEVDVTDADAVRAALDGVAERHGAIDVLVNNAGVARSGPAAEADLADWQLMVEVNLGGVLNATHAALPHLLAAASGTRGVADLVTVSSASGRRVPKPESNVYAATKHAVGAFSEGLRQELGPQGVRVGLVEPGFVVTELTAGRDFGEREALQAEDVADAIGYMVTRPAHMGVNELLVRAVDQVS
ncbi:SDR family oxidoreductase [Nocardioides aequoreus]|uniref:SDR family oxidoreductase n=1 Tax=Nocardioides aequoreus TaxID=397278 RepID=UPI0004C47829|nr:SDR family oxidoreductase [Nocardioides aequoreus]